MTDEIAQFPPMDAANSAVCGTLTQVVASEVIRCGTQLCPKTRQLIVQALLHFATVHLLNSLNTHQIHTHLPSLSTLA